MHNSETQSVILEEGALRRLEELLTKIGARRLFFVFDRPAFEHSGAAEVMRDCLANRTVTRFSDFELNPRVEDVEAGMTLFRQANPDVVLALGGGSALDMAKLIATCGVQTGASVDYITGKRRIDLAGPPIIAIPTTAGTGSEATHFAVAYVGRSKFSLAHQFMLPRFALIDPELTRSLPRTVAAASGLDALSQAIESIWAVGATEESIEYASTALELALGHLEDAVRSGNPAARREMSRAAYFAGKAINISKTTAPHALSYSMTKIFNVPHGMAVSLTLGAFLEYNYGVDEASCNDPRGADAVRRRIESLLNKLGDGSLEGARHRLQHLIGRVGCAARLSEVGIQASNLAGIVENVNIERMSNNPRKIDGPALTSLLRGII